MPTKWSQINYGATDESCVVRNKAIFSHSVVAVRLSCTEECKPLVCLHPLLLRFYLTTVITEDGGIMCTSAVCVRMCVSVFVHIIISGKKLADRPHQTQNLVGGKAVHLECVCVSTCNESCYFVFVNLVDL